MQNYHNRILLSSVDPLAMPAGDVDTNRPRIKDGTIASFTIASAEKKVNPEKGTESIAITLASTKELQDTAGNVLAPGFRFTARINGASGKRTNEDWVRELATCVKSIYGPKTTQSLREFWDNPNMAAGKPVDVKVKVQKEQNGFPESNVVGAWIIPTA